ncbi:hypothetical protein EOE48_11765 [Methylobacterium oryzihabitans]|uniref:Uncharacterized protein n=1 Tax=Methylobacterium oryzihabitans TaxID=2499852 RepID=A0A437P7G0_9HYPH|nr:hypothetical protein EOE48_11765 [Methylobacterium oryzihabitans]
MRAEFDDGALTRAGRRLAGDLGPAEPLLPRELPRRRPASRARPVARTLGATAMIALLSLLAREQRGAVAEGPAAAADPALAERVAATPAWLPAAADRYRLAEAPAARAASRSRGDGGREDRLAAGDFASIDTPYLDLGVSEGGEEPVTTLYVSLVRRAAETEGLAVTRSGERGQVATRFGMAETLDATLADAGTRRACTAFRLGGPFRVEGWLCAPLGLLPEAQAVACAIDRLQAAPGVILPAAAAAALAQPRLPACAPPEPATTASTAPGKRRARHNAAGLRQSAQASP